MNFRGKNIRQSFEIEWCAGKKEAVQNQAIRIHQAELYEPASHYISVRSNSNILSRPNGILNAHHCIYHTVHRAFNISPQNIIETATQRSQREQQMKRLKKQQHRNRTGNKKIDRSTVIHSKNARKQKLH